MALPRMTKKQMEFLKSHGMLTSAQKKAITADKRKQTQRMNAAVYGYSGNKVSTPFNPLIHYKALNDECKGSDTKTQTEQGESCLKNAFVYYDPIKGNDCYKGDNYMGGNTKLCIRSTNKVLPLKTKMYKNLNRSLFTTKY